MNDSDTVLHREKFGGDVGFVEFSDFSCGEPLDFELGGRLDSFNVRYETYGRLNEDKSNAILVCHALTGDHHCAGVYSMRDKKSGWWNNIIGPEKPLDTNKYFVICSNCIGGCRGTTGPSSINPKTGERYNLTFPAVTIRDMVAVQERLVSHLGIKKLSMVIGGSMGGMQALQWAIDFPDRLERVCALATTSRLNAQSIAFNEVGRSAIMQDPVWNGGNYELARVPSVGLGIARMMAHITYLSDKGLDEKFGREHKKIAGDAIFKPSFEIENYLHRQSPDIAAGVDRRGAGDQGIMFGYAKNELGFECDFMPLPIKLAHRILKNLSEARHLGQIPGIEPDSKSQVTVRYNDERQPVGIEKIVVSTQHRNELSLEQIRQIVMPLICRALPENWMPEEQNILINPSGRFVTGGPDGDTGLTGRKIIVDTYGGYAPHGGGAFSGKDATKVDRSAAYMLRYLAKNVVAAGLAEECLLQISYAIGIAEPLSLYINTNRTAKVDEQKILKTLREMTDLTPQGIIRRLKLQNPIYTPTAAYGHFGRQPRPDGCFSWEKLDLVEDLKHAF